MVFTGEMDQISRKDAEEKAKAAGAKVRPLTSPVMSQVMTGVSGNVQFLVVGSRLDDGRPVEETSKWGLSGYLQSFEVQEDDGAEGEGQEAS